MLYYVKCVGMNPFELSIGLYIEIEFIQELVGKLFREFNPENFNIIYKDW